MEFNTIFDNKSRINNNQLEEYLQNKLYLIPPIETNIDKFKKSLKRYGMSFDPEDIFNEEEYWENYLLNMIKNTQSK